MSFVISGARKLVDRSNDELLDLVINDLHTMIPASRDAQPAQGAGAQGEARDHGARPGVAILAPARATPIANLFLAGDWIQTGLPATIESAVISGRAAAAAIAARVGDPARAA